MGQGQYRSGGGRQPKHRQNQAPEQVVVEAILKGIGAIFSGLSRLLFPGQKSKGPSGVEFLRQRQLIEEHWGQVEFHAVQERTLALAVSEADKLLDAGLQLKGIPGNSLGERLKAARDYFPPKLYQEIWNAHKLRNTLAHEVGATASPEEMKAAVKTFKDALIHLQVFI